MYKIKPDIHFTKHSHTIFSESLVSVPKKKKRVTILILCGETYDEKYIYHCIVLHTITDFNCRRKKMTSAWE